MKFNLKPSALLIVSLFLAGCEVLPDAYLRNDIQTAAKYDQGLILASQEALTGPISLSEAMARAVKYNLENRMELMRTAVASRNFELVKMDMMPVLAANAGLSNRSNYDASRSYNVTDGTDSYSYSTSNEHTQKTIDGRFVWNILDFGVSYMQAKQESDRHLISELGRKKIMLTLLEQVRTRFWMAATLQQVSGELNALLGRTKTSLEKLKKIREEKLRAPLDALQEIRILVEIVQQLEEMQQTISLAEIDLASLINVPPGSSLVLAMEDKAPVLEAPNLDIVAMEILALSNSSDYVGELYNARIDQLESRKALVRLLPGLEFSYGLNYDSNRYLYSNTWGEAGLKLSFNIFRLLALDKIQDHNEARENLALSRRLTTNMAIVTKLHLAWQKYQNAIKRYELANYLGDVDAEIANLTANARSNKAGSGTEQIKNDARAMRSKMGRLQTYADAQGTYGTFLFSLGLNPVPKNYQSLSVASLSPILDDAFVKWGKGDFTSEDPVRTESHLTKQDAPAARIPALTATTVSPVSNASLTSTVASTVSGWADSFLKHINP